MTQRIGILGCLIATAGCGGHAGAPPTPIPAAPSVTCPSDIALISHQGQPQATASFDTPTAQNGQPPVTVACTPASGSGFPDGTTIVTCEATDSLARKARCMFSVAVTPVPRLDKTRFLAFGDSITQGKTTLIGPGVVVVDPDPTVIDLAGSYPDLLDLDLSARYTDQAITVVASGVGNEEAGEGKIRLRQVLPSYNPDALLLLEGVNELLHTTTSAAMSEAITSALNALQNMVDYAKSRGVRVLVATLLPIDPNKIFTLQAPAVDTLNGLIRQMAAREGVTLVDLNAVVTLGMLGADGLHPKAGAYPAIADAWFKAIVATMETKTSALPQNVSPARGIPPLKQILPRR
jgi:lysophospholipase L1-like esterase